MRLLKHFIILLLCLLTSTMSFADDIFSTTYGEKWVTIQGVGVTGRYAYVSNYAIKHGTISDTSNPGDEYLWCLVQSGSNIYIYNKSLGNGYQPSVSSSTTSSITMGTANSNTFTVSTSSYTKSSTTYSGYYIKPTNYSQYWSLYGGESWSSDYPSAVVGYWNSMDHNCLWNIEVFDQSSTETDNSDAGSSVSKDGYQLVFSSETADLASKYLTSLTDTEKEKCSGSFVDQDALETKWDYCTKGTAVWKSRMGTTEAEQRQMQGFSNETLNMYAKQVTSASDGTSKFLTSGIQTKDYYKYGIIEVKAKCNAHTSNFPAIWIMPQDHASDDVYDVPWPACGECDIMEQIGTSSTAYGTVHTGIRYNTFGKSYTTSGSKSVTDAAYHIYTLVWDESSLTWYYDGTQLWQYKKDTSLCEELQYQQFPYNKPYRIILDQAVGKNSSWGSEDPDASYTYDMDVAYVRVFQKTAGYTDPTCSFQEVTVDKTYQIKASTGKVLGVSSSATGQTVKGVTADASSELQQWTVKGSARSGYYFVLANTSYYMQNGTSSVTTAADEWTTNQCADGAQEAQTFYYTSDNKLYTLLNDNSSTKYYLVLSSTGTLSTTTSSSSATTFTFVTPTTTYTVTCSQVAGGTISATPTSATEGETITLSNTPNSGYTFGEYTVTDASGSAVTVNYDGTFTMPASNVTVTASFTVIPITYIITCNSTTGGTVTASATSAVEGATITLSNTPSTGYTFGGYTVKDASNNEVTVTNNTFTMPASNVTVSATFTAVPTTYTVTCNTTDGGTVTANPTSSEAGKTITLTVTPESGYELSMLTVTDGSGTDVTVTDYKFTMPSSNVTVYAAFSQDLSYTRENVTAGTWESFCLPINVDIDELQSHFDEIYIPYDGTVFDIYDDLGEEGDGSQELGIKRKYAQRKTSSSDGITGTTESLSVENGYWSDEEEVVSDETLYCFAYSAEDSKYYHFYIADFSGEDGIVIPQGTPFFAHIKSDATLTDNALTIKGYLWADETAQTKNIATSFNVYSDQTLETLDSSKSFSAIGLLTTPDTSYDGTLFAINPEDGTFVTTTTDALSQNHAYLLVGAIDASIVLHPTDVADFPLTSIDAEDPEARLDLTDSAPTLVAGTYKAGNVTYTRTGTAVKEGNYASVCVPFKIDLSTVTCFSKIYLPIDIALYYYNNDGKLLILLDEADMTSTLEEGQAFIGLLSGSSIDLVSCESTTIDDSTSPIVTDFRVYNFDGNSGAIVRNYDVDVKFGGTFVKMTDLDNTKYNSFKTNGNFGYASSVSPFRAFVYKDDSASESKVSYITIGFENDVTGIQEINNASEGNDIYDLQGRKVPSSNSNIKGVYIVNGKKLLIR